MKATLSLTLTLAMAAILTACGNDDPVDPDENTTLSGLDLSASVVFIAGGGSVPAGSILALEVEFANNTSAPIEVHYPAGCGVRARLYLVGNDNLLYDQTLFPCSIETTVGLTIPSGETRTLSSGTTFPYVIQTDSVPAGFYRATAVLRVTGGNPIEIEAGQYRLPNCPAPNSCTYVGPPATIDTSRRN
jgi:hypothetical protein